MDSPGKLRSHAWFDSPADTGVTALCPTHDLYAGLGPEEPRADPPIIGIAASGSDIPPCNHPLPAKHVRKGIRETGAIAIEYPAHPIQEAGKRPTAGSAAPSPILIRSTC